jgi:hypothetical protein
MPLQLSDHRSPERTHCCAGKSTASGRRSSTVGPQRRRFGFGYQTAHDLSHRQDFLDAARGLSGSEKCLVRPTGLMRRQDLVP